MNFNIFSDRSEFFLAHPSKTSGHEQLNASRLLKQLDEKVARLHLAQIGVKLTERRKDQADTIGVPRQGPFKSDHYRY